MSNPAARLAAFTVGEVLGGGAAPGRRQAPGLPGGDRRRREADRLRRPERARRDQGGRRPARRLHPRHRHHDQGRQDPRRREPRHDALASARWSSPTRTRASSSSTPDAPVGARYIDVAALRPGHRDRGHAEPARRARRRRHRPRPRRPRPRPADHPRDRAGAGRLPLPGRGLSRPRRGGRGLPALRRPADPRREERPLAAVAAGPAARHRAPADLGAGRHHQLRHPRPRPAAARLRRRQAARADHGAPRPPRRDACARSTARTTPSTAPRRWSATRTARRASAGSWAACARACTEATTQRLRRGGLVRPGAHRPHRPAAAHRLGRPLSLRARGRPGLHPGRHGARHRA